MRLETAVKSMFPAVASLIVGGCEYTTAHTRTPTIQEPIESTDADTEPATKTLPVQAPTEEAAGTEQEEVEPEDSGPACTNNTLLLYRKYHSPYGRDEVRDDLLAKCGLEKFPREVLRHHDRYARKGQPIPDMDETIELTVERRAVRPELLQKSTVRDARDKIAEARPTPAVERPVKTPTIATGRTEDAEPAASSIIKTIVIRYAQDSWRLGRIDYARLQTYVDSTAGIKCITVTGYASESEDTSMRQKFADERAKSVADWIRSHTKGTEVRERAYGSKKARLSPDKQRRTVIEDYCAD